MKKKNGENAVLLGGTLGIRPLRLRT